jgi:hypothetical protein
MVPPTKDSSINYVLHPHLLRLEHVVKRVTVLFEPKLVSLLYIGEGKAESSEWVVLGRVDDDQRIAISVYGPGTRD